MGILVVDNDLATLRPLLELLRSSGYRAAGALDFDSAVTFIRRVPFDLLIAAVRAGEDSSLDLVRIAVEQQPEMAVIVHTSTQDSVVEQECEGLGVTYLSESGRATPLMKIVADTMGDLYRRRRWERKHVLGGFAVRIGDAEARLVDMSYGGFRLEMPVPPQVELPSSIRVSLPSFGLSVTARLLWSRNVHPEGTGPWITGAALSETDESITRAWRMVVDALPDSSRPHLSMLTRLLHDILKSRVYDVARETPLDLAPRLSRRLSNEILLKREDLQPVFSFKLRGAYNKIAHLREEEWARGIITASAGNHSQGVAFSARKLGLKATIVMPQTTPQIKVDAVRAMGAVVELAGDSYADAKAHCDTLVQETGLTFIHPFDDPLVIAGQGTIGAEILRHSQDRLSAVFVPVGGGGLIAGIAGYLKSLRPDVKVIGVEPYESDAMYRSMQAGRRVKLEHVGIFADGVAVREVGEVTFPIVQQTVDEIVRVSNDEICAAIKDVFDDTRTVMEPAGALSAAGLKAWVERGGVRDQSLVAVLSGANINFDRLRFVAERAELGEAREALLAVTIPERPGAFREFCAAIGRRVVTEFNYRLSGRHQAHIFVGIATQSRHDAAALASLLSASGYETADLTDNEMAKLHVRHMVGGHAPEVRNERLCRFEFPERPGALTEFLDKLGGRWNISLFHYRNHGADFGRVLAGFEVEEKDLPDFRAFLETLGYPYSPESDNPAYRFFLG